MTTPSIRVGSVLSIVFGVLLLALAAIPATVTIVFQVKYPESGIHSPARHIVLQALVPTAVALACPAFGAMVGGVAARQLSLPGRFLASATGAFFASYAATLIWYFVLLRLFADI